MPQYMDECKTYHLPYEILTVTQEEYFVLLKCKTYHLPPLLEPTIGMSQIHVLGLNSVSFLNFKMIDLPHEGVSKSRHHI